jgi:phage terminase large subunit-like protein
MEINELKELCENDLYFLTKNILGYSELEEKPHLEICEFLEGPELKKLLLLPRGTFKTTIGTISRAIQRIIQNPDIRILIFSETYNQAKKFLSEIKQQLEGNKELIGLYGSFIKDPGWKEEEITVRQRKKRFKEPTIMTGGVDVVRVGFHYDLIIIDDPHSQKNIATKDQIDKVRMAYRLLYPMLEPNGEIDLNGTRWHFYDLASHILEDPTFTKMVKSAEVKKDDGTIEYFFPQRLSKEFLKDRKNNLGSYLYSVQYQNNPVDDKDADFKKAWFKNYKEEEIKRLLLNTYITIDPAVLQKEEADFTGVIINSVDLETNWYIRKTLKLKIKPPELINKIFEWNEYWRPIRIGIEKEKYSQVIKPFLDEEMSRRNIFPPVTELTPKVSNKEMRIRGLSPRYERGKVYHNAEDEGRIDLEDELLRFPKAQNDDLSDALSFMNDIAKPPESGKVSVDYSQKKRGNKYKYLIRK